MGGNFPSDFRAQPYNKQNQDLSGADPGIFEGGGGGHGPEKAGQ